MKYYTLAGKETFVSAVSDSYGGFSILKGEKFLMGKHENKWFFITKGATHSAAGYGESAWVTWNKAVENGDYIETNFSALN